MSYTRLVKFSGCFVAVFIAMAIFYYAKMKEFSFKPRCPLFIYTGFFCPGCGSLRAISAALQGNLLQALHYNFLLIATVPLLMCFVLINQFYLKRKPSLTIELFSGFFIKTVLLVVACFCMLRNIPAYPFNLLAPTTF